MLPTEKIVPRDKAYAVDEILAADREIRIITEPWMARLSALLSGMRAMSDTASAWLLV